MQTIKGLLWGGGESPKSARDSSPELLETSFSSFTIKDWNDILHKANWSDHVEKAKEVLMYLNEHSHYCRSCQVFSLNDSDQHSKLLCSDIFEHSGVFQPLLVSVEKKNIQAVDLIKTMSENREVYLPLFAYLQISELMMELDCHEMITMFNWSWFSHIVSYGTFGMSEKERYAKYFEKAIYIT